ncbi:MAG: DUF6074 family protein [Mesorhizobium sp.]
MADLIAFPVEARVGKVRATARSIHESRSAKEATFRWRRAVEAMESSLIRAGLVDADLHRSMDKFMCAVDLELIGMRSEWRLTGTYDPQDTGGGAA